MFHHVLCVAVVTGITAAGAVNLSSLIVSHLKTCYRPLWSVGLQHYLQPYASNNIAFVAYLIKEIGMGECKTNN